MSGRSARWDVSQAAPNQPANPMGGQMFMMLIFMLLMTFMLMNPGFRSALSGYADPVLSPWLPEESFFTVTVLIIGTCSMLLNTILRNFFIDPVKQAHIQHRMSQVRKMGHEARIARDSARSEKAQTLQMHMMPEQMAIQMGGMKPMMFTFIFIIAIFSWIALAVENYRVSYVSLPWIPKWSLLGDKFLFFPAWIATYICLSAPLGRAVDRHIKLWRYKSHPVVLAGERIKEPLLHLIKVEEKATTSRSNRHRKRAQAGSSKKKFSGQAQQGKAKESASPVNPGTTCPVCEGVDISRLGDGKLRCGVCRHNWR